VFRHIESTGLTPQLIIVHDYTSKDVAGVIEDETIEIYRMNGWHLLNRAKAGALGALPKKWTKDRCMATLKKCSSLSEFKVCFPGAYKSCLANKWIDEVYQIYPENYTEDEIRKEAIKYQYRQDFWRYSRDAYNSALKQRLLGKICSEFDLKIKKDTEDDVESLAENISENNFSSLKIIAQKYQTRNAFKKGDNAAYKKACKLHVLQVICSHMANTQKFWSKEECSSIALKYNNRREFRKNDEKAYNAARDHKWLDDICAHMPKTEPQKNRVGKDKAKHNYVLNNYKIELLYLWEHDLIDNPELCKQLIQLYIDNNGLLGDYHSFNYHIVDNSIELNESKLVPEFAS
jgi:hypothetical protein